MIRARPFRTWLWLLLAATLFMRAFVPQGYMPERSAGGAIAVALCSSDGVHLIPLRDGADRNGDKQRAESPCAFAGLAAPALPPPAMPEPAVPAAASLAPAAPAYIFALSRVGHVLPPARGPPLPA